MTFPAAFQIHGSTFKNAHITNVPVTLPPVSQDLGPPGNEGRSSCAC